MKPSQILPLAAVLLACNAFAGFYATAAFAAVISADTASRNEEPAMVVQVADYPGKPAPVLLSPFARAIPAPESQGPALGSLTPPDTETDAQRSLRRAAEATAKVAGIFADPDCRPGNPVTLVGCNEYPPEDRR
jgi:hypothetical protein